MTELLEKINHLIAAPDVDRDQVERTLTDGYAYALSLETEHLRLEKRISEVAHGIQRGDMTKMARELSTLTRELDGTNDDLAKLRSALGVLRRRA